MKKIIISTLSILLLSMALISCKNDTNKYPDMEILALEDVSSDWVDGYWSGTVTHDVKGSALVKAMSGDIEQDKEIDHSYLTARDIKKVIEDDGKEIVSTSHYENCVYANTERTKMVIEEIMVTQVLFTKTQMITTKTLTKDENQSYW